MPFYLSYPVQNIYMTELEYEQDMERMKELYPEEAKRIQALVEEECDKMEYEGSTMFDEYPDRVTLRMICARIYDAVMRNPVPDEDSPAPDEGMVQADAGMWAPDPDLPAAGTPGAGPVEAQHYGQGRPPAPRPGRPPRDREPGSLIEVLLYNEMYKRRCRHNRCRRWW